MSPGTVTSIHPAGRVPKFSVRHGAGSGPPQKFRRRGTRLHGAAGFSDETSLISHVRFSSQCLRHPSFSASPWPASMPENYSRRSQ
eukprot:258762-Hanusia_phi.AAC.5